jgi:hypothetical protein
MSAEMDETLARDDRVELRINSAPYWSIVGTYVVVYVALLVCALMSSPIGFILLPIWLTLAFAAGAAWAVLRRARRIVLVEDHLTIEGVTTVDMRLGDLTAVQLSGDGQRVRAITHHAGRWNIPRSVHGDHQAFAVALRDRLEHAVEMTHRVHSLQDCDRCQDAPEPIRAAIAEELAAGREALLFVQPSLRRPAYPQVIWLMLGLPLLAIALLRISPTGVIVPTVVVIVLLTAALSVFIRERRGLSCSAWLALTQERLMLVSKHLSGEIAWTEIERIGMAKPSFFTPAPSGAGRGGFLTIKTHDEATILLPFLDAPVTTLASILGARRR